jgi:hypothetical protein
LIQGRRGQRGLAPQARVLFALGQSREFAGGVFGLLILPVQYRQFAGHIVLQRVLRVSVTPGFQDTDGVGPLAERDVGGGGIVLRDSVDTGTGDDRGDTQKMVGGSGQAAGVPLLFALFVDARREFFFEFDALRVAVGGAYQYLPVGAFGIRVSRLVEFGVGDNRPRR